jgi:hypothetical protein
MSYRTGTDLLRPDRPRRLVRVAAFLVMLLPIVGLAPLEVGAQEAAQDWVASAPDEVDPCYRPLPPVPSLYATRAGFVVARETYYRDVSRYLSVCIDGWVNEARSRYQQMFQAEVEAYMQERQAVLDEVRREVAQNN